MKQTRVSPVNDGSANNSSASGESAVHNSDLLWVDEVAALLPEDLRLGWYRNVKPWISTLPPEDEVAHLAYSMGYLALLIRNTPALVAAERAKLAAVLQQLSKEAHDSLDSTAAYHHRLEERLSQFPAEIVDGINTAELAATITKEVHNQFLRSGLPEAGRSLREQGERLHRLASEQSEALLQMRVSIGATTKTAREALESVETSSCRVKDSIELWDRGMRCVQWLYLAIVLFLGSLLGALLSWWIAIPQQAQPSGYSDTIQSKPDHHAIARPEASRHGSK